MMSAFVLSSHSKVLLCAGDFTSHAPDHIYDTIISLHANQLIMDTSIVFQDIIHLPVFI